MSDPAITAATIAAAERLAGVGYSEAERALMLATIAAQVAREKRRRAVPLGPELAPATVFAPMTTAAPRRSRFRTAPMVAGRLPRRDADIAFAPLGRLATWLRRRRITAERLTELYRDRLERIGGRLECVITATPERAREAARRADREIAAGRYRGPLHGVPWAAKDLMDSAAIPTTWGAAPYRRRVPERDAWVVARLEAAGAVLIAKTSVGELAWGDVWFGGLTRNPWQPEEGASGSSAGSAAAVAAGLVGFALGTETYGSIVSPAMRCGVTGLRPTFGRVGRTGTMPLAWSMDKIGPLCRTVEDTALVLRAINGADAGDPASREVPLAYDGRAPLGCVRLGYLPAAFESVTAIDRQALETARSLGFTLVPVTLPDLPYDSLMAILWAEAAAAHEGLTLGDRDDELVRQDAEGWPNLLRQARFISAVDLVQAQRLRRRVMAVMEAVLADLDALIGPSLAEPLQIITNMTGHPSLTLRAGFVARAADAPRADDEIGAEPPPGVATVAVPHGITLWGRPYDEGRLLAIGRVLEAAFDVWHRRPPLPEDR